GGGGRGGDGGGLSGPAGGAPLEEGGDDLPPALVGKPAHAPPRRGGMQRQAVFDLAGRDFSPAADDHVVDAPGDKEIAVGVEIPGIASEIPAMPDGLGVGGRPAPIALE